MSFVTKFVKACRARRRQSVGGSESLESRTMLTTLYVTSEADAGAGSFRDAIEQANADESVDRIVFKRGVNTVDLDESVEYTGVQELTIIGRNAEIIAGAGDEGAFDLFVSSGDADLTIKKLNFRDGQNGIFVPVSADATGTVAVTLRDVSISGSDLFGLWISDQVFDSDASIDLKLVNVDVQGNGIGALDFDGVRVDEGGLGDIFADISRSRINGNGGDGLELDERGEGSVFLKVNHSTFSDNGFFNAEDLDDGLDIDEDGIGDIVVDISKSSFNANFDEGLDLDEAGEGDVRVKLNKVVALDNLNEGIKADEEDEGSIIVDFDKVVSNRSVEEEGIALSEIGEGDIRAKLLKVETNGNGKDGIDLTEEGEGSLSVVLKKVEANGNGDNGVKLEETGEGDLAGSLVKIEANGNGEFGIEATQETVSPFDFGSLSTRRLSLTANGAGDTLFDFDVQP